MSFSWPRRHDWTPSANCDTKSRGWTALTGLGSEPGGPVLAGRTRHDSRFRNRRLEQPSHRSDAALILP
jgi:hypothetical protein